MDEQQSAEARFFDLTKKVLASASNEGSVRLSADQIQGIDALGRQLGEKPCLDEDFDR